MSLPGSVQNTKQRSRVVSKGENNARKGAVEEERPVPKEEGEKAIAEEEQQEPTAGANGPASIQNEAEDESAAGPDATVEADEAAPSPTVAAKQEPDSLSEGSRSATDLIADAGEIPDEDLVKSSIGGVNTVESNADASQQQRDGETSVQHELSTAP